MRCVEIWIRDNKIATIGHDKLQNLTIELLVFSSRTNHSLSAGATFRPRGNRHEVATWHLPEIADGQQVTLKLVDSESPDPPSTVEDLRIEFVPREGEEYFCSFCGKGTPTRGKLYVAEAANICSECIAMIYKWSND